MKILGILGSSRSGGNTEILLDIALEKAGSLGIEVSKIYLRELTIGPCDGCNGCFSTGECVVKDDMKQVYEGIRESDGIIWASPVYFWSMSGLTKMAMDRTYALNFPELQQAGKIGGLILVAGIRGCLSAASPFHMYFNYNHMFAAEVAWGYAGARGDILKDEYAKKMSEEMVLQMHALYNSNLTYPEEFRHPLHRHVMEKYRDMDSGKRR
jgi:multimeric flavodoxin WrbA